MREYNFKASDNNGEMLMGLSFPFSFMRIAGLILILRLHLFPKIKFLDYVNNSYLERLTIIFPALVITPYIMKIIKKYIIKDYHIYGDRDILKIENDNKIIELSYNAIRNVKLTKKGKSMTKCYKLIIKISRKNLKFFVRPKENYFFGGSDKNDFYTLEEFYFFLKEKVENKY